MDTDKPLHDLFHILGFFFISVAKTQHRQLNVDKNLERIISDACKIIAQDVPEAVRYKLHRLGTEVQAEFRKVPYEQISPDHSCLPDTTTATIVQHGSPNGPDEQQVEHDSPTRTFQPSKQTLAAGAEFSRSQSSRKEKSPREGSSTGTKCSPEDNEQPFLIADLKSWAQSPKPFLSSGTISIDDLAVFDYIQALEKSSQMTKIARRFALLQLWVSKEVWRPLPPQEFKKRLGTASGAKFNRWLREGRTLFLLKAHKGIEVLFSKLKSQTKLTALSAESKAHLHTNAEPNVNRESYDNIEFLLQSQHTEEAKKIVSCFDGKELELPRSCEDCVTNSKLYRDAASSISKYLEELHIKRLFGDQTQLRHRLEVRENERPAKRWRRCYGLPMESPSNLGVIRYHFDQDPMHNDSGGLPYATESTTDAGSDGGHEAQGASTDADIPVPGSLEDAGSQLGALVMPGSDSSLIATPSLEATAGGYETQPSTEITIPVRNIEADMGPVQLYSPTGRQSTHQLNEGYLNRPCADIVENLDECRGNITQLSSVSFGIHETLGQALSTQPIVESSLPNWLHIDASSFNFDTAMFEPLGALEAMEFNDYQGELNAQ
ncbi:hypothetical protein FOXG_16045 [Fusarium oxysporum f. sp. lycopersici 4287]|uniref:Uncharacterized protein n=1 Tax=Fusarium oxysporum f. sp. lycopersici (strain 4287 / CBS 123668 / FGSC 9935 / NRRL 34936) TaxID=426428 RepID=A0A0J9WUU0_FUSO4|nr:hypothetical protein FOXG_15586 [Fusarium oxysporum f. sp. lycopersici 4287]XP_018256412.1 uncharacterized protein FOXG_16045 [Fusarium oxysporum f. sp. lycopersici 4287]KNB17858.1 hypothetical protein FOXG_15586 [Fusarium oxysporum f. sp. lycopersici 4287]KNB18367.1 hypothetical protein FOXG_16045 [Fusarium oxysporum f. sp. lycopersici 4287]